MGYYWDATLSAGAEVGDDELAGAGVGRRFDDQAGAEDWLSQNYLELTELGVDYVTLYEEDRLVYGPMSLAEQ